MALSKDTLNKLNAVSGPGLVITVRVHDVYVAEIEPRTPGKKSFSVVATMVFDKDNNMTHVLESLWGDSAARRKLAEERRKYWMPGGQRVVFNLSKLMKVVSANTERWSSTVPCHIMLEGFSSAKATVKVTPLLQSSEADKTINKVYVPPFDLSGFLNPLAKGMLSASGVLVSKTDPETTSSGPVQRISLHDGSTEVPIKIWGGFQPDPDKKPAISLHNFWMGVGEDGGITVVVNLPQKSSWQEIDEALLQQATKDKIQEIRGSSPSATVQVQAASSSGGPRKCMADYAAMQGHPSCCYYLHATKDDKVNDKLNYLHRIEGGVLTIDPSAKNVNSKDSIFAQARLEDLSGNVLVRVDGEVLAELAGLPWEEEGTKEELCAMMEHGSFLPARAACFVNRTVGVDVTDPGQTWVRMQLVAVSTSQPFQRSVGNLKHLPDIEICPCKLACLQKQSWGKLVAEVNGQPRQIAAALVMLQGGKGQAKSEQEGDHYIVRNRNVTDALGTSDLSVELVAQVPLRVQTQFALEKGKPALALITGYDMVDGKLQSLIASHVWKASAMGMEASAFIAAFEAELDLVHQLASRLGKKRPSAEDVAKVLGTPRKRKCTDLQALDASPTA